MGIISSIGAGLSLLLLIVGFPYGIHKRYWTTRRIRYGVVVVQLPIALALSIENAIYAESPGRKIAGFIMPIIAGLVVGGIGGFLGAWLLSIEPYRTMYHVNEASKNELKE